MGKFRVVAKFTDLETAKDKKSKGAETGEWQILTDNITIADEIMDILPVTSIHTALTKGVDVEIDNCISNDFITEETAVWNSARLKEAFELAERCAVYQGRFVTVVVHLSNSFMHSYKTVVDYVEGLLGEFSHCNLAIENTMLFQGYNIIRTSGLCSNTVNFVVELRNRVQEKYKDRIGTVLDVCHALATIRFQRRLFPDETISEIEELTQFFIENEGVCKVFHFNNCTGLGVEKIEHGTVFTDEKMFRSVVDNYLKYTPDADFVIEIQEEDYSNSVNFERTVKQLKSVLGV